MLFKVCHWCPHQCFACGPVALVDTAPPVAHIGWPQEPCTPHMAIDELPEAPGRFHIFPPGATDFLASWKLFC